MTEHESLNENQTKTHGGARLGAGRPLHSKNPDTIEKEEAIRQFKERVARHTDRIFNSQLDLALGEKYLMVVRTIGKGTKQRRETEIISDPELIKQYLDEELTDSNEEYYFMTTKGANNQALEALLNRAYGRPKDTLDVTSNGRTIGQVVQELDVIEKTDYGRLAEEAAEQMVEDESPLQDSR